MRFGRGFVLTMTFAALTLQRSGGKWGSLISAHGGR
jgi:hypothetical protein